MAEQYDVTEGQCPEDCPDVEVATYCINELQQVQNISRVNVKKCCPEDCPCDGECNSEGCTLCGKCDGHPGFDLPKTFCVADTQPAQNVARVNVNKTGGDSLWEVGGGNILQPKENKTFTIKKASEVNAETGSADKFLNEQGDFTKPLNNHKDLEGKNAEAEFQHITLEQKASLHTHNNKESLDNYNPALFATASQGEKADSALQALPPNIVVDADYSALKDKVNGIEENANNYQHPLQHSTAILAEVSPLAGNPDKFLNERGNFTIPILNHKGLTDKNQEAGFQHVDTTITKETLVNDDKVTIYDSVTGKVVLTDKSNVQGGGSTDITLKNENIGSARTVVVDTAYDWHVVSKTSGGAGVFTFDFANGVLPTKNKEYLIILKNDSVGTLTVTMPTGSITVGGVVFNFNNSISTFPLNAGKTAEINVIAVFLGSTTCNIRITTQSSI